MSSSFLILIALVVIVALMWWSLDVQNSDGGPWDA